MDLQPISPLGEGGGQPGGALEQGKALLGGGNQTTRHQKDF